MATILLRCPSTGKYLSTGIEAEPETFWALPDLAAPVRCPHCRSVHDFAKRQALLVDPNRWSEHPKVEDCLIKATECVGGGPSARDVRVDALGVVGREHRLLGLHHRCHGATLGRGPRAHIG